jgi:hypothetical protein
MIVYLLVLIFVLGIPSILAGFQFFYYDGKSSSRTESQIELTSNSASKSTERVTSITEAEDENSLTFSQR